MFTNRLMALPPGPSKDAATFSRVTLRIMTLKSTTLWIIITLIRMPFKRMDLGEND
jgi:hypothetical protein